MKIEVSNGEIADKISILNIKMHKMIGDEKFNNVNKEFLSIKQCLYDMGMDYNHSLFLKLIDINSKLWDIEDKLRIKEKNKQFDEEFIQLARSVYFTNDERSRVKKEINELTKSNLTEEKSYQKYE